MKAKVTASAKALESIGCDRTDIIGNEYPVIKDFKDGYLEIAVPKEPHLAKFFPKDATDTYDIPRYMLEIAE